MIVLFLRVFALSILAPLTPVFLKVDLYYTRLWAKISDLYNILGQYDTTRWLDNVNLIALVIILFFLLRTVILFLQQTLSSFQKKEPPIQPDQWGTAFTSFIALFISWAIILIIVILRLIPRSEFYLEVNLYYFYPMILFMLIGLYGLGCIHPLKKIGNSPLYPVFIVAFMVMITLNMYQTHRVNVLLISREARRILFMEKHGPKTYYQAFRQLVIGGDLVKAGKYEAAIRAVNASIKINPLDYSAYDTRGNALAFLGDLEAAIKDYNRALVLKPDYFNTLYNRANAYFTLKKWDRAIQDYEHYIEMKPYNVKAYLMLANAHKNNGQTRQAISVIDRILAHDPRNPKLYYFRAQCWAELNEWDKAREDTAKAQQWGYPPP